MIFEIILAKAIAEGLTALAEKLRVMESKIAGTDEVAGAKPYNGIRNSAVDFSNKKGNSTLLDHFDRHGDGFSSPEAYRIAASNFLEKPVTPTTYSFVTNEGTYFRYDAATNEFGIMNKYGGISTYYKPPEGINYWLEQVDRYAPK